MLFDLVIILNALVFSREWSFLVLIEKRRSGYGSKIDAKLFRMLLSFRDLLSWDYVPN